MRSPDWLEQAACKGTPIDMWFPQFQNDKAPTEAAELCAGCPVRPECLHDALQVPRSDDNHAYVAGTTPADRRRIRRHTRRHAA